MKILLVMIMPVFGATASFGQGTLNFATRNLGIGLDAPLYVGELGGPGPGPSYTAALYLVNGQTDTLIPESVTTFQAPGPGASAALARYVVPKVVAIPGVPTGSTATPRIKAWPTADGIFETAGLRGVSEYFTTTALGGGPIPPGDLPSTLNGFVIPVPEPSTLALGGLGVAALLLRWRGGVRRE